MTDHMIKIFQMKYLRWKYWHSSKIHAITLAVCVAYDTYLGMAEGELGEIWKDPTPCNFWTFRDVLSAQMLKYDLIHNNLASDARMQLASQYNTAQRKGANESATQSRKRGRSSSATAEDPRYSTFARSPEEAKTCRGANSCLCIYLSFLGTHLKSVDQGKKHRNTCKACGKPAYSKCGVCCVHLHAVANIGQAAGNTCFYITIKISSMAWHVVMHLLQAQLKRTGHTQRKQRRGKTQSLCKRLIISLGSRFICYLLVDFGRNNVGKIRI